MDLEDFPRLLLMRMVKQEQTHKLVEKKIIQNANDEAREMTGIRTNFRQTLVPLSWIANWFKKEHWKEARATADIIRRPSLEWKIELLVLSTRELSVEEGEDPLEKEKEHLENAFVQVSCYSPSVPDTEEPPSHSSKDGSPPDHSFSEASSPPIKVTRTEDENDNDRKRKIDSSPSEKEGRRPSKSTKLDDDEGED